MLLARIARTSLPVVLALVATPLLNAGVIVVDAGGGGDFTTLTDAVAAAANGDTILTHDGNYIEAGPVVIDGKPLSIVAEWTTPATQTPSVTLQPGLLICNLAPGEFVYLENLGLQGALGTATSAPTSALVLRDNNSHVRAQNCGFIGGNGNSNAFPHGAPGVDIQNSYSTGLTGCVLAGGSGQFSPIISIVTGNGGAGLSLVGGQVHLSHSLAFGGPGGSDAIGGFGQGGKGGAGVAHTSGTLLIVSTVAHGGEGGTAFHGGDGGDGLQLGATGFAWLMAGSGANGGNGGGSDDGPSGDHGSAIADPGGIVTDFGGDFHAFDLTSPLREGEAGSLSLGGDSSDTTLVFASLAPHQIAFPAKQGVLMLDPNALIGPIVIGVGSARLPFVGPALPAALASLNVHVQPVYVGVDGVVIGPGRVLTLLDGSF